MQRQLAISLIILVLLLPLASWGAKSWLRREMPQVKVYPVKERAYRLLREGNPEEALPEFEKLLALQPEDTAVRLDYCQTLSAMGRYEQAAAEAARILRQAPGTATALFLGADAYHRLGRDMEAARLLVASLDGGALAEADAQRAALTALDRLITLKAYADALSLITSHPGTLPEPRRLFAQGLAHAGLKQNAAALQAFSAALAAPDAVTVLSDEERSVALNGSAAILAREDNTALARRKLEESFTLAPGNAATAYMLAHLLLRDKHPEDALLWIDRAIAITPGPEQIALKALILTETGQGRIALQLVDDLLRQELPAETRYVLLMRQGYLAEKLQDSPRAVACFTEAVSIQRDQKTLLSLAAAQERAGMLTEAETTYHTLLAAEKDATRAATAQLALSTVLTRAGKPEAAITVLTEALAWNVLPPAQQVATWEQLGFLLYGQKDYSQAETAFQNALQTQPGNRRLTLALARTHLGAQEYDKAQGLLNSLPSGEQDAELLSLLAIAYERGGDNAKAVGIYQSMLDRNLLTDDANAAVALERLAFAKKTQGSPEQAGEFYLQAYRKGGRVKADLLLRAGEAFSEAQAYDRGLAALREYMATPSMSQPFDALIVMSHMLVEQDKLAEASALLQNALTTQPLDNGQKGSLLIRLGNIAMKQGDTNTGVAYMRQAMDTDRETSALRLEIGQALFSVGNYDEALTNLLRAKELGAGYEADSAIAFCYDKLGKSGLGLFHMEEAQRRASAEGREESPELYDQLAYLNMSEKSYDKAAASYRKALSLAPNQTRRLGLGRALRLMGQWEKALAMLQAVEPDNLDVPDRARLYEELGRAAMAGKQYAQAESWLQSSLKLENNTPELLALLGQVRIALGRTDDAITDFSSAYAKDPRDTYAVSLGYALYHKGNLEAAADIFETQVTRDPDDIKLVEELAYINKKLCRNHPSVEWFHRAIDNAGYYPDLSAEELRKKIYGFKDEARTLSDRWRISGYYSLATDNDATTSDGQSRVDVLDDAAGVEVGYTPESFGFRNGKVFQFIGRMSLGHGEDETATLDGDTTQGAIGVRYKPFNKLNLALGAERLFKVGSFAEENTLLRLMGSWDDGWNMRPTESDWNYTFLFIEADQYLEDESRTEFTAHARQGHTWNIDDQWLITPHLFVTYKNISPDANKASHIKGGPGLSIRWLEGEDAYSSFSREWEFLVRYNYGTYLSGENDAISGVSVNIGLTF